MQVEADPQVGPQLAQHRRDQLELVVLHPDDRVLGGELRGRVGESLVDRDVGLPPLAVEGRLRDEVVVERPQGGVGEALVELVVLLLGHGHRDQREAFVLEGVDLGARVAGPADPGTAVGPHHGLERRDEPTRGAAPADLVVLVHHAVDGQAVGDDHQVGGAALPRASTHAWTLPAVCHPDGLEDGRPSGPSPRSSAREGRARWSGHRPAGSGGPRGSRCRSPRPTTGSSGSIHWLAPRRLGVRRPPDASWGVEGTRQLEAADLGGHGGGHRGMRGEGCGQRGGRTVGIEPGNGRHRGRCPGPRGSRPR